MYNDERGIMEDIYDIIRNVESIYSNNTAFQVLKDFERVLDEMNLYVYDNWFDGELASGPHIERHWVTVRLFWPRKQMPDPMGAKKLTEYGCKVKFSKNNLIKPRKIRKPSDIRSGTRKGKLDHDLIWIVEIQMPKTLVADIYTGYQEQQDNQTDPTMQSAPTINSAPPTPDNQAIDTMDDLL